MASELKRRKIIPPPRRTKSSYTTVKETVPRTNSSMAAGSGTHLSLEQAKNLAVAQAQQEGCTGNFCVFDSLYGNFLIPATPTRAELSG